MCSLGILLIYCDADGDQIEKNIPPFTDLSGKIYKVVKIGDKYWMAENLTYKPTNGNYWAYGDAETYGLRPANY